MQCIINQQNIQLQHTAVYSPPYHMYTKNFYAACEMTGPLHVQIKYDHPVSAAVVRPLSAGITPTVMDNTVTFALDQNVNISVEADGNLEEAVQFFPWTPAEPDFTGYEHIYRFEAGEHDVDELHITENDTAIYLAPGAVVHGRIFADGVDHLKVFGPGAVTMRRYHRSLPEEMTRCIEIRGCSDVRLEDIMVLDSCNWSVRLNESEHIRIHNIKIIGCRSNSDGIDVTGSRNVHISGCFIRTYDDSFVVKSLFGGNVENVLFETSTLWNDMARPIEVGVEMRCSQVKNITFRNIDVIHSLTCYPIFGIHHGDRAHVSNIRFEDIRIEHTPGAQLFDFRITDSVWNKDTQKGDIRDIIIDNIHLVGQEGIDFRNVQCRIEGFSDVHDIRGVRIGRIDAFGKRLTGRKALGLQSNAFARDITFDDPADTPVIVSRILEDIPFTLQEDGYYHGTLRLELTNHLPVEATGSTGIKVYPRNKYGCDETPVQFRLASGETASYRFDIIATPGKLAAESWCSRVDFRSDLFYREMDYMLTESVDNAPRTAFTTLYGDRDGEVRFALRNNWLEIRAEAMKHHDLLLYSAVPPAEWEDNQVLFAVEEAFFGEGPCVKWKNGAICSAPEIGNHLEITYVFLNQPKVDQIRQLRLPRNDEGLIRIPMVTLGWPADCKNFWMELELKKPTGYCKPYTLFRSTLPSDTAHMFCNFRVK